MRIPPFIAKYESWWRRIATAAAIIMLSGCVVRGIVRIQDGDFKVHWETGRRFLAGEFLYGGGHDFPYPPLLGFLFAPAALMPMAVAKAVLYPLGIAALLLLLWLLHALIRSSFKLNDTQAFWAAAF